MSSHTLRVSSPALPVFAGSPLLHPVRLAGHEGVNSLFEYELILETPDLLVPGARTDACADIDLDAFVGREVHCEIELDGAGSFVPGATGAAVDHIGVGTRHINALIAEAELLGEDGRHLRYRLVLRPTLHRATLNSDCRIFQNQTPLQILDALLAPYAIPVDKRLVETYPLRDFQTQFNESDFVFFERLCQKWGISYHFEHDAQAHRLVLGDHLDAFLPQPSEAYRAVAYHPPGWKVDAEYIHAFRPASRLTSGRYSSRDYDYTRPRADLKAGRRDPRPTGHSDAEVYAWHAALAGSHYAQPDAGTAEPNDPRAEGDLLARIRMEQLRTAGARSRAAGNLRALVPGFTFALTRHPRTTANAEYLVLDTDFSIEDTAQDSQVRDAIGERRPRWRVSVDLVAHPLREPLRPDPTRMRPHTHGPQTARVVGPEGQNVWTDELGRIKVQFPWDREGGENENSSCWVRVSSPWAGNQMGGVHLPRVGQEVVIDFIAGDPDLPLCTGRVHNQLNLPPWHLPDQAALSGFRSRELKPGGGNGAAGRSNHLVMDDTADHLQTQLKSDHQCSSLSMGSIARIDDHQGRQDPRGDGFELRTEGHGAVRATEGLLISTEARPDARAHITDMPETIARLAHAGRLHGNLGAAARQARAQDTDDQDDVAQALAAQNDDIRGTGRIADPDTGRFAELEAPHIVLASPAGIGATSARDTHLHAGGHLALTADRHASIAAGRSFLASARKAIRLFAHEAGMRLIAHAGDIEIKALKHGISVMAQLSITQTADEISIVARKKLTLGGGGSTIRLDGAGIEHETSGFHRVHASVHGLVGPRNSSTPPWAGHASLADDTLDAATTLTFVLRAHAEDGRLIAMEPYALFKDGAEIGKGATDARGRLVIQDHTPGTGAYKVRLSNGNEFDLPVVKKLAHPDEQLAARGYRAAQDDPQERQRHVKQRRGDIE